MQTKEIKLRYTEQDGRAMVDLILKNFDTNLHSEDDVMIKKDPWGFLRLLCATYDFDLTFVFKEKTKYVLVGNIQKNMFETEDITDAPNEETEAPVEEVHQGESEPQAESEEATEPQKEVAEKPKDPVVKEKPKSEARAAKVVKEDDTLDFLALPSEGEIPG